MEIRARDVNLTHNFPTVSGSAETKVHTPLQPLQRFFDQMVSLRRPQEQDPGSWIQGLMFRVLPCDSVAGSILSASIGGSIIVLLGGHGGLAVHFCLCFATRARRAGA